MSRQLPPLDPLRAFEAAARHLSFTRAAEELFVTPSAVSHQIKALEESLGITMFLRESKALVLTAAGKALLVLRSLRFGQKKSSQFAGQALFPDDLFNVDGTATAG